MATLEKEREFFRTNQAEWSKQHPGKFVLIKEDSLIGVFDTPDNAVAEGMRQFGTGSFLVRSVEQRDDAVRIPALMFGLINADAACSM